jgi:hypothetical protein
MSYLHDNHQHEQLLTILGAIQRDVNDLRDDVIDLNKNMSSVRQDLASLKEGMAYNFDNLSTQFVGIVHDFSRLGDDMYRRFDQWSEKAVSSVVEKVLEVHTPRLRAIEKHMCMCGPPKPVTELYQCNQPCLCSTYRTSNETGSEDPGSSKGKGSVSLKSAQTSNSGGTFGCH